MIPIIYADLIDDVGNRLLFEEIYEKYYQQMFFVASKILHDDYEAEDALQDAFIRIAKNMKTISAITNQRDLFYYLMRAAENAAHNRTRQTKHYTSAATIDNLEGVSDHSFWESVCTKMDYERLVSMISNLPKKYREVLYYHYVLEFSVPEVARGLGLKLSTAKQRLVRGKKILMSEIEREGRFHHGYDESRSEGSIS